MECYHSDMIDANLENYQITNLPSFVKRRPWFIVLCYLLFADCSPRFNIIILPRLNEFITSDFAVLLSINEPIFGIGKIHPDEGMIDFFHCNFSFTFIIMFLTS